MVAWLVSLVCALSLALGAQRSHHSSPKLTQFLFGTYPFLLRFFWKARLMRIKRNAARSMLRDDVLGGLMGEGGTAPNAADVLGPPVGVQADEVDSPKLPMEMRGTEGDVDRLDAVRIELGGLADGDGLLPVGTTFDCGEQGR